MWKSAVNRVIILWTMRPNWLFLIGYSNFKALPFAKFDQKSPVTCSMGRLKLEILNHLFSHLIYTAKMGVQG